MDEPPKFPAIAALFNDLIKSLNITPYQLAKDIGIDTQKVYNYVAGNNKPSYEIFALLASVYPNLDAKWLLTGEGEPFPNGRYNEKPAAQLPPPSSNETLRINSDRELAHMMTEEDIRIAGTSGAPYRMRRVTRTPEEEIEHLRAELLRERQAHERTRERHEAARNQNHERETQLIATIGNLGKNEASADAADEHQAGPMAISHRGPEAETTYTYQRYQAQEAAPYKRVVVAGFAS